MLCSPAMEQQDKKLSPGAPAWRGRCHEAAKPARCGRGQWCKGKRERSGGVTRLLGAQVRRCEENTRKAEQEHRGSGRLETRGNVIPRDKEMKRAQRDLTMKCKCLHWRKARRRQYHESLFQSVSCLHLIKVGIKVLCFILSLTSLIQTQISTMAPVAFSKTFAIHETGLQQVQHSSRTHH